MGESLCEILPMPFVEGRGADTDAGLALPPGFPCPERVERHHAESVLIDEHEASGFGVATAELHGGFRSEVLAAVADAEAHPSGASADAAELQVVDATLVRLDAGDEIVALRRRLLPL